MSDHHLTPENILEIHCYPYNLLVAIFEPDGSKVRGFMCLLTRGPQDLSSQFARFGPLGLKREHAIQRVVRVLYSICEIAQKKLAEPDEATADWLARQEGRVKPGRTLNRKIIARIEAELKTGRAAGTYLYDQEEYSTPAQASA